MQYDFNPKKILIVGKSGHGKTVLQTRFILNSAYDCYFVYDHDGQFATRLKFRRSCYTAQDLDAAVDGRFVVFNPAALFPGDIEHGFDFFCEWAFEKAKTFKGKKLLSCDELQKLQGSNQVSRELKIVLQTGRHAGLDFLAATLALNEIHNSVRAQCTELITFQNTDPLPLKWLEQMGFDCDEVRQLSPGSYVWKNLETGAMYRGTMQPGPGWNWRR